MTKKEKLQDKQVRAGTIVSRLTEAYPGAHCGLHHQDAFQLLVATMLSAQCTDDMVNRVTPALFRAYPDVQSMAGAGEADLKALIRPTGFFNTKARNILACSRILVSDYDGRVPDTLEALTALPGVGRKTANVVLGEIFGISGIVVDTHVGRISRRLGLTAQTDPVKVEFELMKVFDQKVWTLTNHLFIEHGRAVCKARRPDCDLCTLASLCPQAGL